MKNTILLLFLLFNYLSLSAQVRDLPRDQEPGKCYAKCLAPGESSTYEESYPVYIGEENSDIDLELIQIQIKPASTKWVQKKADRHCMSADPKDCLVWCLVETPAEWEDITVVIDTSQTDDYVWETFTIQKHDKFNSLTEWREVLCGDQVTQEIITQIQHFLQDEGYLREQEPGLLDVKTKAALTAYQRHHNLPIGQLDKETLNTMGIYFW